MRKLAFLVGAGLCAVAAYAAPCGGHGTPATMLVSTQWLADHLKDPNLVVIGIGQKAEFDAGHIPGSHYLDNTSFVLRPAPPDRPNSFELPPVADLAKTFGDLGVSSNSRVVIYTTKDFLSLATRVYMTLDALGLGAQSSLLDGGYPAWQKEGRPTTTEVRAPKPAKLEPCAQSDVVADVSLVKSSISKPGVRIVDARAKNFYTGETPGRNMRPGRIPGSGNLFYLTLVDETTGKFRAPEEMQKLFDQAGVKKGDRVVTYCHIGQTATVVYFASRYLGYDTRLYDGSFEEWSRMSDLPVEK